MSFSDNLASAVAEENGTVLIRHVVIYESFGEDGTRAFYWDTSDDGTAWDALGLLRFASLQAEKWATRCDPEEDDE